MKNVIEILLKIFFVVTLVLNANISFAFNWDNCSKKVGFGGNGLGLFVSTSSFVSSTGHCAAIGQVEDQKKHFIAHNLDRLIIDSSKGAGEYLSAYLLLSGCSSSKINETGIIIQKNLQSIYGNNLEKKPEESYKSIDALLTKECRYHNFDGPSYRI